MTDELFEPAKRDNFATESPIRAFASFDVSGSIAIGKGFRPSLGHLAAYLGAMRDKEGWRVVQVLVGEAGRDPTIIFEKTDRLANTWPLRLDQEAIDLALQHAGEMILTLDKDFGIRKTDVPKPGYKAVIVPDNFEIEAPAVAVDMVNHPPHYNDHPSGLECIEIKRHMSANIGDAFKYVWRFNGKGKPLEDLKKSLWYINDEIERLQRLHEYLAYADIGVYFRQCMLRDDLGKRFTRWISGKSADIAEQRHKRALYWLYRHSEQPSSLNRLHRGWRVIQRMIDAIEGNTLSGDRSDDE